MIFVLLLTLVISSCKDEALHQVSTFEFREFVKATGYITDAEKFDWTIVQIDILNFEILYGVNWRCPTGRYLAQDSDPVTQVSYRDALAFANWKGANLPTYSSYWDYVKNDTRAINTASNSILPNGQVNIIGNVWEITIPDAFGNIRLAGGSYLCDKNTCNGTDPNRELFVDQFTGNSHIGFAIIY